MLLFSDCANPFVCFEDDAVSWCIAPCGRTDPFCWMAILKDADGKSQEAGL